MADIKQSDGDAGKIRFTAKSNGANLWMIEHYEDIDISLSPEEARQFKDSAKTAGFTVASF